MANFKAKVASLLIILMVAAAPHAEAAITCATILTGLSPCIGYLRSGGAPPFACCDSLKRLYGATSAPPDRRAACSCVKTLVPKVGANPVIVNSIGAKCGVNIPYKYSPSLDCSKIN